MVFMVHFCKVLVVALGSLEPFLVAPYQTHSETSSKVCNAAVTNV